MLAAPRLLAGLVLLLPLTALQLEGPAHEPPTGPHGPRDGTFVTGTSVTGNFQEALDSALETARARFAPHGTTVDFSWRFDGLSGRRALAPDTRALTVVLEITRGVPPELQKKAGPGGSAPGGGF